MAVQLPAEAVGQAAGILFWSLFNLGIGFFFLWLVWVHNERLSYMSMLGSFITLHTIASVIQQIHTIDKWNDIKADQWINVKKNVGNPELNITGASTGLDLVLFYIQYYSYNVESLLIVFWAVELGNSIFQLRIIKMYRIHASLAAKTFAALLPVVQMVSLRFSAIQSSTIAFMTIASAIMIACFLVGSIILFTILVKYVHSRIMLINWDVRYGRSSNNGTNDASGLGSGNMSGTGAAQMPRIPARKNIYDKWLVLRFTIAFVALGLFQLVVVMFQVRAAGTNKVENIPEEPDLSADRAKVDFLLYLPAVTAPLLVFIVFGTTRTFREYSFALLAPKCLQRKREERKRTKRNLKPSVVLATSDIAAARRRATLSTVGSGHGHDLERGGSKHGTESISVRMQNLSPTSPQSTLSGSAFNRSRSGSRGNNMNNFQNKDEDSDELPIMKPLPSIPDKDESDISSPRSWEDRHYGR